MPRNNPSAIVTIVGALLCGCASTQTHTTEAANTAPNANTPSSESPVEVANASAHETTTTEAEPATAPTKPDIGETCPLEVKRQIECKDKYLPMIVGVRIKLDFPKGTAERGKDAAGRAALVALAHQEHPDYYSVDKIPVICRQRQAMVDRMPPEMIEELTAIGPDCHTEETCEGFTQCVAPMVERILAWTASTGAPH